MNIIYIGWFIPADELFDAVSSFAPQRLEIPVKYPHITLAFRPSEVDTSLFGSAARLTITGYGNDGENEGVSVTVEPSEPILAAQLSALKIPHITLSVSASGKPLNTAKLDFLPVPPCTLTGIFGAFTSEGTLTLSPDTAEA